MAPATAGRVMATLRWISLALVVIGALNWGVIGLLGVDLIAQPFGAGSAATQALYVLIGAAGAFVIGAALTPPRRRSVTESVSP